MKKKIYMPSHELVKSNILKSCFHSNHVPVTMFSVLKPSQMIFESNNIEYKIIMKT